MTLPDQITLTPEQWASLLEVAHDWRYSDQFLGNLLRSMVGRSDG